MWFALCVATFTARTKRAFFRSIYKSTSSGATTFLEALESISTSQVESISTGGYLINSVSSAGNSTSFVIQTDVSPLAFADLAEEGIDLYDAAIAAGATDDASVWAYFATALRPIRRVSANFVGLRYEGWAVR